MDEDTFWECVAADRFWDGYRVKLAQFALTEWVPLRPGALASRQLPYDLGEDLIVYNSVLGKHYTPDFKESILQAGGGCARYGAVNLGGKLYYVMGCTSSESCDRGIPVILDEDQYHRIVHEVRDVGYLPVTVSGRVRLLPRAVATPIATSLPAYYVSVDDIEILSSELKGFTRGITASAFISFRATDDDAWRVSFCYFRPGRTGTLEKGVSWLLDYANHYAGSNARIMADFDAYHSYFDNVDLPLRQRLAGVVSPDTLKSYAEEAGRAVIVYGDYVQGDQFKGVKQSTILNRSAYAIGRESGDRSYNKYGYII